MLFIKKLSPESNRIVRAWLYSVGFWGSIHICSSSIQAIHRRDASGINALRISNIYAPVAKLVDTPAFFIGGWLVFWAVFYLILRFLKKSGGVPRR
jgi:hypothetical protein